MAAYKPLAASVTNSGCGMVFLGVWLGLWSLCTLVGDGFLAYSAFRQCWTYTYSSTQGTVASTKIESNSDSEGGTTYTPQVQYTYTVNGRQFQADRINFLLVSSSHKAAENVVNHFPAGQPVTVYYNPASPGDSVLLRGIDGMGLFMAMFFLPFNVIMVVMWYAFFSHLGPGKPIRRWLHFSGRDDGLAARLTIYPTPPLVTLLAAAGAAGFLMIFVVGFGMSALPVMWLAAPAWIVVLAAGFLAWQMALGWGVQIEVDRLNAKMTIHQNHGVRYVAAAEVQQIDVDTLSVSDSEGNQTISSTTYLLCKTDGGEERIDLCTFSGEDLAQWVREWVREKLRKAP